MRNFSPANQVFGALGLPIIQYILWSKMSNTKQTIQNFLNSLHLQAETEI
jgi:hypothetical protein